MRNRPGDSAAGPQRLDTGHARHPRLGALALLRARGRQRQEREGRQPRCSLGDGVPITAHQRVAVTPDGQTAAQERELPERGAVRRLDAQHLLVRSRGPDRIGQLVLEEASELEA
jgi:hypothetical protein